MVTLHRPSNVDLRERLIQILETLISLSQKLPLIWPLHPRTRSRLSENEWANVRTRAPQLLLENALPYLPCLSLLSEAAVVLTDSGGIQQEATYLGVPCMTLRETTEWTETLGSGANVLVSLETVSQQFEKALKKTKDSKLAIKGWDGATANRIVTSLRKRSGR